MITAFLSPHPYRTSSLKIWQHEMHNNLLTMVISEDGWHNSVDVWISHRCCYCTVCVCVCVCVWLPFLQLSAIHKDNKRPACCHIKNKLQHMLKLLDSSNEPQWTVWRLVRQQCVTCIVRSLWRSGEVHIRAEYYLLCRALGNNQHWGGVPL